MKQRQQQQLQLTKQRKVRKGSQQQQRRCQRRSKRFQRRQPNLRKKGWDCCLAKLGATAVLQRSWEQSWTGRTSAKIKLHAQSVLVSEASTSVHRWWGHEVDCRTATSCGANCRDRLQRQTAETDYRDRLQRQPAETALNTSQNWIQDYIALNTSQNWFLNTRICGWT